MELEPVSLYGEQYAYPEDGSSEGWDVSEENEEEEDEDEESEDEEDDEEDEGDAEEEIS